MNNKARILIVDDDPVNIMSVTLFLQKEYDIYSAESSHAVIDMLDLHKPDLVLLDVMMPGISGFDLCASIKEKPAFAEIPVILLSALDEDYGELRGIELGAIDYLSKPVNLNLLKLRIRNHLALKERNDLVREQRDLLADQQQKLIENRQQILKLSSEQRKLNEELESINEHLQQRVDESVAELRRKDQVLILQSRQAAMGEMIGNIAHQWRQPLNALSMVLGNIQSAFLFQELTGEYLAKAVRSGNTLIQKMSTTIDDFRKFFMPDKKSVPFFAMDQIRAAVGMMEGSLKHQNISLRIEAPHDLLINGFPNEYSQVLLNLLSNARDAIRDSGASAGAVTIRVNESNGVGSVSVIDNGGGISADLINRIFEPYFTTKEMGTGIGLYMSKMIIEHSMKGAITVQNSDGGAEFTVSVPAEKSLSTVSSDTR